MPKADEDSILQAAKLIDQIEELPLFRKQVNSEPLKQGLEDFDWQHFQPSYWECSFNIEDVAE